MDRPISTELRLITKHHVRAALYAVIAASAIVLAGCGGGSGSSVGTPDAATSGTPDQSSAATPTQQSPPFPAQPVSTQVRIASDVMAKIALPPTHIYSAAGEAGADASLQIPQITGGRDTLVVAVDDDDNIILAAAATGPETKLTPESTAIALVRLAVGWTIEGELAEQTNERIRRYYAFGNFVTELTDALGSPGGALASERIRLYVNTIASTLTVGPQFPIPRLVGPVTGPATLENTTPQPSKLLGATTVLAVTTKVAPPLPVKLVGDGASTVELVAGGVELKNKSLIAWSATSSGAPGAPARLPPATYKQRLGGQASDWLGVSAVHIPNNGGRPFELTVEQNDATRRENVTSVVVGLVAQTIQLLLGVEVGGPSCELAIASALVKEDELTRLISAPSKDALVNYINTLTLSTVGGELFFNTLATQCAPDLIKPSQLGKWFPKLAKILVKTMSQFARAEAVADASSLFAKMATSMLYIGEKRTVTICETGSSLSLSGYAVVSCASKFDFGKIPIKLAPGATYKPIVQAYTSGGLETGSPAGLIYESSNPSIVQVDRATGELTAMAVGVANISITDPVLGVSSMVPITVPRLALIADSTSVDIGAVITVRIVEAGTNAPVEVPSSYKWDIPKAGGVIETGPEFALFMPRALSFRATKEGQASVAVTQPNGQAIRLTVRVNDPSRLPVNAIGSWTWTGPWGACRDTDGGTLEIHNGVMDTTTNPWQITGATYLMSGLKLIDHYTCQLVRVYSISGTATLRIDSNNRIFFTLYDRESPEPRTYQLTGTISGTTITGSVVIPEVPQNAGGSFQLNWLLPSPQNPTQRPPTGSR